MARLYPPSHPLGSACLKVERANIHIAELNASIVATLPAKTAAWQETEFEGLGKGYETLVDASRPPEWGTIIGDIVGNLRQSLDHIAWALAIRQSEYRSTTLTDDQAKCVIFPLSDNSGAYRACKALPFIWAPALPDIEQLQPYPGRNRPELELLGILQELSNMDKHRIVTPTAMTYPLTPVDFAFVDYFECADGPMRIVLPPSVVARLGDDFKPETAPIIGVRSQVREGEMLYIWELALIHDLIRDHIIPLFARHFP